MTQEWWLTLAGSVSDIVPCPEMTASNSHIYQRIPYKILDGRQPAHHHLLAGQGTQLPSPHVFYPINTADKDIILTAYALINTLQGFMHLSTPCKVLPMVP